MDKIIIIFLLFLVFNLNSIERYKVIIDFKGYSSREIQEYFLSNSIKRILDSKKVRKIISNSYNSKAVLFVECRKCIDILNTNLKDFDYRIDENYFSKNGNYTILTFHSYDYDRLFKFVSSLQDTAFLKNDKIKVYGELKEVLNFKLKKDSFYRLDKNLSEIKNGINDVIQTFFSSSLTPFQNNIFPDIKNEEEIKNEYISVKSSPFRILDFFNIKKEHFEDYDGFIEFYDGFYLLLKSKNKLEVKKEFTFPLNSEDILYIFSSKTPNLIEMKKKYSSLIKDLKNNYKLLSFFGFYPLEPDFYEKRNALYIKFNSKISKKKIEDILFKYGIRDFYFKSDKVLKLIIFTDEYSKIGSLNMKILNLLSRENRIKKIISYSNKINSNKIQINEIKAMQAQISRKEIFDYIHTFCSDGDKITSFYKNEREIPVLISGENSGDCYDVNFNIYLKNKGKFAPVSQFGRILISYEDSILSKENNSYFLEYDLVFNSNFSKILSYLFLNFKLMRENMEYRFKF